MGDKLNTLVNHKNENNNYTDQDKVCIIKKV